MVWAITELLVEQMPSQAAYEIAREQAEAVIAQRKAAEERVVAVPFAPPEALLPSSPSLRVSKKIAA